MFPSWKNFWGVLRLRQTSALKKRKFIRCSGEVGGWALKTVKAITSFSDGLRREYTWDFWLTLKTTLNPFREYKSFSLTFFLITCVVLPRGPNPFVVSVSQNLVQDSLLLLTVIDFLDARPGRTKTKNMLDDNHDTAIICWKHLLWVCTLIYHGLWWAEMTPDFSSSITRASLSLAC